MPDEPRVSEPEAAALLLMVHEVRSGLGDQDAVRHLTRALARAAGLPPEAAPWDADHPFPDRGVMTVVQRAIWSDLVVRTAHLQQDGELRELVLEPYHVRLEGGYWYLLARVADDGRERVLRLDKVRWAQTEGGFTPRPLDLDVYADGVWIPSEPGQKATVAFAPSVATYAQERWGLGEQREDGGVLIEIGYLRPEALIRTLALFGSDFEVVAPAELRSAIRARALATMAALATDGSQEPATGA
jgi:predicted DNA-binding transcriptional regulator YafY